MYIKVLKNKHLSEFIIIITNRSCVLDHFSVNLTLSHIYIYTSRFTCIISNGQLTDRAASEFSESVDDDDCGPQSVALIE